MRKINDEKKGLLIHAYNQDGRGLSLQNHLRVYMEQDKGYDTIEADRRRGFKKPDRRNYDEVIEIFRDFKLKNIRLLTNNPHRIESLKNAGIAVRRESIEAVKVDKFNIAQIYMKKKVLGHAFNLDLDNTRNKKLFKESLKKWSHGEYDSYLWDC